ncbi:MAG: Rrf2 family transcriptional regulator [Eubacterium sp.]|jgi:DNA-binding IscR family transcriptional regulator|nr:Rrf2 family transcriptional regulator [Eubacterium sp.]MCH4045925.1 Rrf2 family transcriptional regulator [Eubacterium sp.]MCH4079019.1 Rrf2 family transcriptional regulator [Eubacterium sp.]MCI1307673.1 Rrf2 family transcriptional regulator [Eubacterium sp.]MCI1428358.1 Rrf2 family transcriptional regulator [Eubacterium sp.]
MQISTKFTIAIHILTAITYFSDDYEVTSKFLASSVGCNPVIVRNLTSNLREAGILESQRGRSGATITRPLDQITFLDIYRAVETGSQKELFHFHENPNPTCPVGRNIHQSLNQTLEEIQEKFEEELSRHTIADVYDATIEAIRKENVV